MTWWIWIIFGIVVYCYMGFNAVKFRYFSSVLNYESKPDSSDISLTFFLWWLYVIDDESRGRSLLPSLWLWSRFRDEWPTRRAESLFDDARRAEFRQHSWKRDREIKNAKITNQDLRESLQHEHDMKKLREHTERLHKQLVEGPAELESPKPDNEPIPDWYCKKHNHWVNEENRQWNCE